LVLLEHRGISPQVHPTAYVAPTAVVCGDVRVGPHCRVLFGTALSAEGGPVELGEQCIVMENAVLRGTPRDPLRLGNNVLTGPRAYLTGCTVEDNVFLATGTTVFNGARIGTRSEVRVNAVVHLRTHLPPDTTVPIGWIAVGDPAQLFAPGEHERLWQVQQGTGLPRLCLRPGTGRRGRDGHAGTDPPLHPGARPAPTRPNHRRPTGMTVPALAGVTRRDRQLLAPGAHRRLTCAVKVPTNRRQRRMGFLRCPGSRSPCTA
jgi:carbonic anhydrase/acetyltransferase-like protein (isoleucine patch superfamily)